MDEIKSASKNKNSRKNKNKIKYIKKEMHDSNETNLE